MSTIRLPIRYEGSQGEKVLYTLFDSGATFSCIHPDYVPGLATLHPLRRPKNVLWGNGLQSLVNEVILLDFHLENLLLSDEFAVVPGLSEMALIGAPTLQKWRIKLDFEHDTVIVYPKVAKLILKELKPFLMG